MPTTHSYKKVYARLLQYHVDGGFSPESFGALETTQHKIRQDDPQATWVDAYDDFTKPAVSLDVLVRWRQEHVSFRRAWGECWSRGLLFYEQRLLECLKKGNWRERPGLQVLLFVLRTRFGDVYGQGKSPKKEGHEKLGQRLEIKDIDDPEQLLYIAHVGREKFGERGSRSRSKRK